MSIGRWLDDFLAALPVRGRARRRILDEVETHLLDAVAGRPDLPRAEAERAATASFGEPAEIARGFAEELGVRTAKRATRQAVIGVALFAAAFLVMDSSGVRNGAPWVVDSPAWPLAFLGAQVAAAGTLAAAVRIVAVGWPPPPERASDLARSAVVASAAATISLGALVAAITTHGATVSGWPLALLGIAAAGLAGSLAGLAASLQALDRSRAIEPSETPVFATDLRHVLRLVRLEWPAELLGRHPWRFCLWFGLLAGAAAAAGHAIGDGGPSITPGASRRARRSSRSSSRQWLPDSRRSAAGCVSGALPAVGSEGVLQVRVVGRLAVAGHQP